MNESDLHLLTQAFEAAREAQSVAGLAAAAMLVLALVQLTKLSAVQKLLHHRDLKPWRPLIAFVVGGLGSVATSITQGIVAPSALVTSFFAGGLAGLTGVGAHQLFKQTPRPRKHREAEAEQEEPVTLTKILPTSVVRRFKHRTTGLVLELHQAHEATLKEPNVKLWNPEAGRYVYRSSESLANDFFDA